MTKQNIPYQLYTTNGSKVVINNQTGEKFYTVKGCSQKCSIPTAEIYRRLRKLSKESSLKVRVNTSTGVQPLIVIPEKVVESYFMSIGKETVGPDGTNQSSELVHQTFISDDGIEVIINNETGESFCSVRGYARLSGITEGAVSKRVNKLFKVVSSNEVISAEIQTVGGIKVVSLISEIIIAEWITKDNPTVAALMLKAGIRLYLYGVAGYKVKVVTPEVKSNNSDVHSALKTLENEITQIQGENKELENKNKELESKNSQLHSELSQLTQQQVSKPAVEVLQSAIKPIESPLQNYIPIVLFMEPLLKIRLNEQARLNMASIAAGHREDIEYAMMTTSQVMGYFKQGTEQGIFPKANAIKRNQVMAMLGWELIKTNGKYYYRYPKFVVVK